MTNLLYFDSKAKNVVIEVLDDDHKILLFNIKDNYMVDLKPALPDSISYVLSSEKCFVELAQYEEGNNNK